MFISVSHRKPAIADPLTVDPTDKKDKKVWGTVLEGDKFPVGDKTEQKDARLSATKQDSERDFAVNTLNHALSVVHAHLLSASARDSMFTPTLDAEFGTTPVAIFMQP